LPVSLDERIEQDGIFCFKIKLRGNDLESDVSRTEKVFAVAKESSAKRGRQEILLSVDTNEQCEGPEYRVSYLEELREASPEANPRQFVRSANGAIGATDSFPGLVNIRDGVAHWPEKSPPRVGLGY